VKLILLKLLNFIVDGNLHYHKGALIKMSSEHATENDQVTEVEYPEDGRRRTIIVKDAKKWKTFKKKIRE